MDRAGGLARSSFIEPSISPISAARIDPAILRLMLRLEAAVHNAGRGLVVVFNRQFRRFRRREHTFDRF